MKTKEQVKQLIIDTQDLIDSMNDALFYLHKDFEKNRREIEMGKLDIHFFEGKLNAYKDMIQVTNLSESFVTDSQFLTMRLKNNCLFAN